MLCDSCNGTVLWVRQRVKETHGYESFYECQKCFKKLSEPVTITFKEDK